MFNKILTFKEVGIIGCCAVLIIFSLNLFQSQSSMNYAQTISEPIYFGATFMNLNNDYFYSLNEEIKTQVTAKDDILISLDANSSLETQIQQMYYLMREGCDVIFLNPVDLTGLDSVIKDCIAQGIVIVVVDSPLENDLIQYSVVSDNYEAGVLIGEAVLNSEESANILILEHATAQSAIDRVDGFIDTIQGNDDFVIVEVLETDGLLETAMSQVQNAIASGLKFNIVMALNDEAGLGALAAISSEGLEGIKVYGVDGSPEAKQLINNGLMEGTVAQYLSLVALESVDLAYYVLENEDASSMHVSVPVSMITKDNIDEFSLEGWQ